MTRNTSFPPHPFGETGASGPPTEARRTLGLPSLTAVVVASMIGSGVFTTSGFALADLHTPGRVMLAWGVGAVVALLGTLSYGALAARLQESGGEYLFIARTVHPVAGFIAGWISLWAGFTGAIALTAETTQHYLAPWIPVALPPDLVGTGLIAAIGFLHAAGVERGTRAQTAIVIAKGVGLVLLVVIGLASLPDREAIAAASPAGAPPSPVSWGTFAVSLMWISLSYSGWNAAVYIAGEAREPHRNVPRAMLLGCGITALLYLALNFMFVHAAPIEALAGKEDVAARAMRALGGAQFEGAVRILIVVALLTSISSMVMLGPRVYAQMADDGMFPARFSSPSPAGSHPPRAAITLQVLLAVGVLWASGLRAQLTNLGWILGLCTALSVVGLLRLRRKEGKEAVPIVGSPVVPILFVAITVGLAALALSVAGKVLIPSLFVLGSGGIAAMLLRRGRSRSSER